MKDAVQLSQHYVCSYHSSAYLRASYHLFIWHLSVHDPSLANKRAWLEELTFHDLLCNGAHNSPVYLVVSDGCHFARINESPVLSGILKLASPLF